MTAAVTELFTRENIPRIIMSGISLAVVLVGLIWLLKFPPKGVRVGKTKLSAILVILFAGIILAVVLARIWREHADWVERCYTWLRSNEVYINIFWTIVATAVALLLGRIAEKTLIRRCEQLEDRHRVRRGVAWIRITTLIVLVGVIWFRGVELGIFLGVVGAGLALSMQEVLLCLAGWALIIVKRPFDIGDRIEINGNIGDVIDIRVFQITLLEVGNWVHADQSTGRVIHVPNGKVLTDPLVNYTKDFNFIWNELAVIITFESNWERAKSILSSIAVSVIADTSTDAREQLKKAAERYMIFFRNLTPIVYTRARENGVELTIRYLTHPRERRTTEHHLWEEILLRFAEHDDIRLAYPTIRYYRRGEASVQPSKTGESLELNERRQR